MGNFFNNTIVSLKIPRYVTRSVKFSVCSHQGYLWVWGGAGCVMAGVAAEARAGTSRCWDGPCDMRAAWGTDPGKAYDQWEGAVNCLRRWYSRINRRSQGCRRHGHNGYLNDRTSGGLLSTLVVAAPAATKPAASEATKWFSAPYWIPDDVFIYIDLLQ